MGSSLINYFREWLCLPQLTKKNLSVGGITGSWLLDSFQKRNISLSKACKAAKLPASVADVLYNSLPFEVYNTLFEWAANSFGDEFYGIHVAEETELSQLGLLGYLIMNSPNIEVLCENIEHYLGVLQRSGEVHLQKPNRGTLCKVRYRPQECGSCSTRQDIDCTMALIVKSLRYQLGSDWLPSEVFLTHSQPEDNGVHRKIFGEKIYYDFAYNAIGFDSALLQNSLKNVDMQLLSILINYANQTLDQYKAKPDIIKKARWIIASCIGQKGLSADKVANELCMSRRTLHRYLKEAGTSFHELRGQIAKEAAMEALVETNATVASIAMKLGFSESSSFDRSFKRLAGISPIEFRSKHKY